MFSKPSVLRRLLLSFLAFGLGVGAIFPLFATLFVEFREGMLGWFVVACVAAGATIGIVNYRLTNWVLLSRLRRLAEVADAVADKQLASHCTIESHDLVGAIAASVNRMAANLRATFQELADITSRLQQESDTLGQVVEETEVCMQRQQAGVNDVAGALEQMTDTASLMADNSQRAAERASRTDRISKELMELVSRTTREIEALARQVEEGATAMHRLESDSNDVGMVLDVIQGIAEQTNLLALNAAIEAARAGEQGRGFAVVADEVRTLASRTHESTEEIQSIINRLRSQAGNAVGVMEEARDQARRGSTQVSEMGGALGDIIEAVSEIRGMNEEIAGAISEQHRVTETINQKGMVIRETAEQATAGAQQTASASRQLAELAERLHTQLSDIRC
ncbi:MAG TPA: methyl-accepting chemotaxis protein [Thiotrichales bacterium]|nr:methyl-accepting chemotaxis protein [Thiotrichales bacterium]